MSLEGPGKGLGSVEADVEPPAARCDCWIAAAMAEERVSIFTVTILDSFVDMLIIINLVLFGLYNYNYNLTIVVLYY